MRVVTVNRPDRKLTKKKKYSEITPPKLGASLRSEILDLLCVYIYIHTYSVLGPAIQAQSPPSHPLWSLRPRYLTHGWLWWFPMYHSYNLRRCESECSNWLGIIKTLWWELEFSKCFQNDAWPMESIWRCESATVISLISSAALPRTADPWRGRVSSGRYPARCVRPQDFAAGGSRSCSGVCWLGFGEVFGIWNLQMSWKKTSIFGILKGSPSNTQSTFWGWSGWSVISQEFDFMEKNKTSIQSAAIVKL